MKLFKSYGILGINARNLLYIKPLNPAKAVKLADDKIKTKKFLETRGIPVPKLLKVIQNHEELEKLDFKTLPNAFALKPNSGFGGEGIIPIKSREDNDFISVSDKTYTKEMLYDQILDILDGRFSISNISDIAFFEQLIIPDKSLGKYSYSGLPDIRVIVYNMVPVMAMLRLPTKESNGKANLHQGACGVGLDLASGKATYIVKSNKIIDEIEGIGKLDDLKVPFWDEILLAASKIQMATNLGYLAVDMAIDKNSGPLLLEINARAGLGVQNANLAPLRKRLERIEGVKVGKPEKGVQIAKDMFGAGFEKKEQITVNKKIIGKEEDVEINIKNESHVLKAIIDPSHERSTLDIKIAEKLNLTKSTEYDDEKSTLKLKFTLKDKKIQTVVDVEKIQNEDFKMIIGERDLEGFLLDIKAKSSTTKKHQKAVIKKRKKNHFEIDEEITGIDNQIKLLFHLRPVNLEEERQKFFNNYTYNPQFIYPELRFNSDTLKQRLALIDNYEGVLGEIFEAKKQEIIKKINLLDHIGEESFTQKSIELFGSPDENLINECEKLLIESDKSYKKDADKIMISSDDAAKAFKKVFEEYGLKNWNVKIKDEMVTDCVAGKNNMLFVRKKATFSEHKIQKLIIHEIETHILTAENGKNQPFEIFNRGLANYLETQEGLAVYNVNEQLDKNISRSYKALALIIAIATAHQASFNQVFEKILSFGLSIEDSFRITLKVKRGLTDTSSKGAFTKDMMYYSGYKQIKEFIKNGGEMRDLYIGKFNLKDLDLIKKLEGLTDPKILPKWLR